MKNEKKMPTTRQSLGNTLGFLEMMADTGAQMTAAEISKVLGVSRTTAYATINTLVERGYLERLSSNRKYMIGYKFFQIGNLYPGQYAFVKSAEKFVPYYAQKLGVKVNVCVLKAPLTMVVLLAKDVSILPRMIMGHVLPAYCTASGKMLLASEDEKELEARLDGATLKAFGPKTITDKTVLLEELRQIREQDYSIEQEELAIQHCCASAPIRNAKREVIAAVSFSCDMNQFQVDRENIISNVRALAMEISADIGYNSLYAFNDLR